MIVYVILDADAGKDRRLVNVVLSQEIADRIANRQASWYAEAIKVDEGFDEGDRE